MIGSPTRRAVGILEPLVSYIYFVPEATEEYEAIGVNAFSGYFLARSAALGRASSATVASTFFNFNPALVEQLLNWDLTDPESIIAARTRAVERAGTRLLAEEDGTLPDVSRPIEIIRQALEACRPEGRPLFAAHAQLPWPEHPIAALWHGANLLREFRGDGHIAVLLTHSVDAVEALVLHAAFMQVDPKFLHETRAWGPEAYADAAARLIERGFLTEEGALSDAGAKFREMIEMETDHLGAPPFSAIGEELAEELLNTLKPLSDRVLERRGAPRRAAKIAGAGSIR